MKRMGDTMGSFQEMVGGYIRKEVDLLCNVVLAMDFNVQKW